MTTGSPSSPTLKSWTNSLKNSVLLFLFRLQNRLVFCTGTFFSRRMGPRYAHQTRSGCCLPLRNQRKANCLLQGISQKPLKQQSLPESILHETVRQKRLWHYRFVPCYHECTPRPPTPGLKKLLSSQVFRIKQRQNPWGNWRNVQEKQRYPKKS